MKRASQKVIKTIIITMLLLWGKVSIANENNAIDEQSSLSESNYTHPNFEQGCKPMPRCAEGGNESQSEMNADWYAKMLELLNESEEKSDENNE